jgi:ABC-type sugar transport system ATPase subunit
VTKIQNSSGSYTAAGDAPDALEAARALVDRVIVWPPEDGGDGLRLELIGELGTMPRESGLGSGPESGAADVVQIFLCSVKAGRGAFPRREREGSALASSLLSLRAIGVSYGAVQAVSDVDLDVAHGEVVALCGDNGAGKSSLVKVLSGAQPPTAGTLSLDGAEVRFRGLQDALRRGMATIYQDLAVAPRLSIWQNVFLGSELTRPPFGLLDKRRMAEMSRGFLARLAVAVDDMETPVERLSGGQRQAVAICRALRWDARIILMDEPTAALGVKETAQVLDLIRRLNSEGRTVILVSHAMPHVAEVATRVVVLKAGRKVADRPIGAMRADDIAHLILRGGEAA